MEKYRKLIFSQLCAIVAVLALGFAIMRHKQTGIWQEPITLSFLAFAVLLFAAEIKLILDWIKTKPFNREQ